MHLLWKSVVQHQPYKRHHHNPLETYIKDLILTMSEDKTVNGTANGTANGTTSSFTIPVVDLSAWKDSTDKAARLRVAREIVDACKKVGFVYIVNHALPESLLDEAFDWSKRFFALNLEEKMKAPHPEGWAVHRGYSWLGLEKVSQATSEGDDDEERVKKLREVKDCKVSLILHFCFGKYMNTFHLLFSYVTIDVCCVLLIRRIALVISAGSICY